MNYRETGLKALEAVGGKNNVRNVTHCATRLRFEVKDRNQVDEVKKDQVPGVMKFIESAGQLQFVIGPSVNVCYQAVMDELGEAGSGGASADEPPMNTTGPKEKNSLVQKGLGLISGIFIPILPALIASGMIKALLTILTRFGLVDTASGVYIIITFAADSVFYFLPILLAATSAKVFGMSQGLAMMLGALLLHPTFTAMAAEGSQALDIFGLGVRLADYKATVIPIILIIWCASVVEKLATRYLPDVIKYVFRPLIVMVVMIPLSLCVLGPIGAVLGDGLAAVLSWIQNTVPWLLPTFIGTIAPLMVLFGLNNCTIPLIYAQLSAVGYETVAGPGMLAHNIAEGAATLALALKSKDKPVRQEALTTSFTALFGGITEPAIYGFTLRFKNVLPCVMIGGGAAGLFAGLSGLVRYATAAPSIVTLPTYMGADPNNIWKAVATLAIAFAVTFILVYFTKTEDTHKNLRNDNVNELNK